MSVLKRKLQAAIDQSENLKKAKEDDKKTKREAFIADGYQRGGQGFVERVEKFGKTERDTPIKMPQWYKEYLLCIGDFRLPWVLTTGPSQCGKTLGHAMLFIDTLTTGKLNLAWFYDTRTSLDQNVPMSFLPVAEKWINSMMAAGITFDRRNDRCINTRFQIDGVNGIFSYVSTSRPGRREDGSAAAGGMGVAYQADGAFLEERSQYAPGSADFIPRRLDASLLAIPIIRELGTQGGGTGIEAQMSKAEHLFYPHYTCPNCRQILPLDPKGCLLRKVNQKDALGRVKQVYLSESGRPLSWFHEDENDAVESAYFACSNCGHPLDEETRTTNAHFRCRIDNTTLEDFLNALPPGVPKKEWMIGIHLSPLTRETEYNLASKMIKEGLSAVSTRDWQEQMLGHTSEHQTNSITLDMIRAAMKAPAPEKKPDLIIAGVDVGRSEDWLAIVGFYLPEQYWKLTRAEVREKSIRKMIYAADVMRTEIEDLLVRFEVEFGLIDNEPSRESSMQICRYSCLEMGDQIAYYRQVVEKTEVQDGGISYPCYNFRNEKFMAAVLEGFILEASDGYPLYRLPPEWEKWIANNNSDRSPIRHLQGPSRDPQTYQWKRASDKVDDFFFSLVFAEAAFYIKLEEIMSDDNNYHPPVSNTYSSW